VSARDLARVLAAGRAAIGVGLLVAPRLSLGMWIGRDAAAGAVSAPARALGIREVMLGTMALHVVDEPGVGSGLLRTLAVCDAVDLLATVAARRSLSGPAIAVIAAMAVPAAAGQLWAAARLEARDSGPDAAGVAQPQIP
jgi:hypothetical protein